MPSRITAKAHSTLRLLQDIIIQLSARPRACASGLNDTEGWGISLIYHIPLAGKYSLWKEWYSGRLTARSPHRAYWICFQCMHCDMIVDKVRAHSLLPHNLQHLEINPPSLTVTLDLTTSPISSGDSSFHRTGLYMMIICALQQHRN